jgi:hypothetical protein
MRVLVLTSEAVSADALREALGTSAADAEVLVVAPAVTSSPIRFWTSDVDPAIERAESVQEETVERLDEEGIDAAGDTGESDPLLAVQDALTTFDADRIVIFTHPDDESGYREDDFVAEVERRFELPVDHRLVTS